MTTIILHTKINAPIERCFDLSRSIDLHKVSTAHTKEEAIDGVTTGLINLGEYVTWRAVHFGLSQKLTSKITEFESPSYFVDEMIQGSFKSFKHFHYFETAENNTIMTDRLEFKSPMGIIGRFVNVVILKKYMKNLLIKRNEVIKEFAESDKWREIIINQ
ncbi:SRPBCC family protein [uncultured Cyclobacterium sp.]|uniref:SRPBCC family protein n=1 Tax=uncultured Cyclobacterium sp. TaxID=453820 RepID=UPI0030EBB0DB|tara:strand:+ start:2407 stop:2886 length:480 start_codon:yes stop_codon:yes gene_type:complete